jgi:hypothetical protein
MEQVRRSGTRSVVALVGVAALAAVAAWYGVGALQHGDPAAPHVPRVAVVDGDDRLPSTTAADWVTYADHVVVVTPQSETSSTPSEDERARGEGVTTRTLQLTVSQVVWSKADAQVPPPAVFAWNAYGWTWHDSPDQRVKLVDPEEPRMELGHTYVMAIEWVPAHCTDEGTPIAGAWRGLGSGSTLPYDSRTLGVGEVGDREVTAAAASSEALSAKDPGYGLKDQMVGKDVASLARRLDKASPHPTKVDYGEADAPCVAADASVS